MLLLSLVAAIVRWRDLQDGRSFKEHAIDGFYATTPLWAMLAIYWLFAVTSHLNIGHRHLLPIYPLLMILIGATSYWFKPLGKRAPSSRSWRQYLAPALVFLAMAWHVIESMGVRPHYLAYFNQLAGGPSQGYRHLVDSSLDWGQDLPGLRDWLANTRKAEAGQEQQPLYLSYFGTGRPSYYDIDAELLPGFFDRRAQSLPQPLMTGVYCFSNTMLQSVYNAVAPGPWNQEYESGYQQLTQLIEKFESTADNAKAREALIQQAGEAFWTQVFWQYDNIRLARLCAYVRKNLEPIAQIGYSINIYQIAPEDLQQAISGPPPYPKR
jgi:hypothetical protein